MNSKILILHSSNDLYGSSKILINVIDLLVENRYEIHLIVPYHGPLNEILKNKVIFYEKNLGVFRKKYFNFFGILNRFFRIFSSVIFINKLIKKNNIKLIYTNTSVIISGGIAAKYNSINSYFHIHEIPKNKLYLIVQKKIINLISDKIVVVSNAVKIHWDFVSKSKVHMIYNGFDFDSMNNSNIQSKNKIVFTSVGRLIPYKGHLYLLNIARELIYINPKFIFHIIGDTFNGYEEYESSLYNYVKNNNLEKNIIFNGYSDNVSDFLKSSHFFIHTAIDPDPLPTVIFESILHDIPVISTNIGGAIEILDHGRGGLLIPKNNIDRSVELILNYVKNEDLATYRKKFAKEYTKKHFSKMHFKKNILSLFEQ